MAEATWTLLAEADLEHVAFHIAFRDKRPITADRIVYEIRQKADA